MCTATAGRSWVPSLWSDTLRFQPSPLDRVITLRPRVCLWWYPCPSSSPQLHLSIQSSAGLIAFTKSISRRPEFSLLGTYAVMLQYLVPYICIECGRYVAVDCIWSGKSSGIFSDFTISNKLTCVQLAKSCLYPHSAEVQWRPAEVSHFMLWCII